MVVSTHRDAILFLLGCLLLLSVEFVVWVWMGSFLWTSLLNRKDLPVHPGLLIELLLKWRRFPIWFKLAITGTSSTQNMFPFKEIQWPPSLVCHMYAIAERIHFPVLSYPLVV